MGLLVVDLNLKDGNHYIFFDIACSYIKMFFIDLSPLAAQSTKLICITFKGTRIFRLTHISYPVSISIALEQHIAKYQTVISSLDIDFIKENKR